MTLSKRIRLRLSSSAQSPRSLKKCLEPKSPRSPHPQEKTASKSQSDGDGPPTLSKRRLRLDGLRREFSPSLQSPRTPSKPLEPKSSRSYFLPKTASNSRGDGDGPKSLKLRSRFDGVRRELLSPAQRSRSLNKWLEPKSAHSHFLPEKTVSIIRGDCENSAPKSRGSLFVGQSRRRKLGEICNNEVERNRKGEGEKLTYDTKKSKSNRTCSDFDLDGSESDGGCSVSSTHSSKSFIPWDDDPKSREKLFLILDGIENMEPSI